MIKPKSDTTRSEKHQVILFALYLARHFTWLRQCLTLWPPVARYHCITEIPHDRLD